jgi:hypothetical protein
MGIQAGGAVAGVEAGGAGAFFVAAFVSGRFLAPAIHWTAKTFTGLVTAGARARIWGTRITPICF